MTAQAARQVSVVIPSYNYGRFVSDAVRSALDQTWPTLEVIVVDDGSTDDTPDVLRAFGDHIRVIAQPNAGLASARNRGMQAAEGEWIALLDADDIWHRDKIRVQLSAMEGRDDIGLAGSPSARELPDQLPRDPAVGPVSVADLFVTTPFGPSGALIRRQCLDAVGVFDPGVAGGAEDRDMWLRLTARFRAVLIESPCWWYRPHEGQMSRRPDAMFRSLSGVVEKFFRLHPEYEHLHASARSFLFTDGALAFYEVGRRGRALQLLLRAFLAAPRLPAISRFPAKNRLRLAVRMLLGDRLFFWARGSADGGRAS